MDLASGRRPRASPMTWSILERKEKYRPLLSLIFSLLIISKEKERENMRPVLYYFLILFPSLCLWCHNISKEISKIVAPRDRDREKDRK